MIDLVFRNLTEDKEFGEDFFNNILELAARETNLAGQKTGVSPHTQKTKLKMPQGNRFLSVGVSVNLVDEAKIQELNLKYRNKDKVTDVLSFPMESELDLGDIFICLTVAKNQAKSENVSIERKLAQLLVHGFLHLLGYDHEKSERDAGEMSQ